MNSRKKLPGESSKQDGAAKPNIAARRMAFKSPKDEVITIPYKVLVQKLVEKTNLPEKEIKMLLQLIKKESKKIIAEGYLIKFPNGYFIPEEDHRTEKKRVERRGRRKKM